MNAPVNPLRGSVSSAAGISREVMMRTLEPAQHRLLNEWQRGLPLVPRPFDVLAESLGLTVDSVLEQLTGFCADGTVSRVGPVFRPNSIGASSLVAVAVPPDELEAVAALVNEFDEVNHNYEREHEFNLWFVATAIDQLELQAALDRMERCIDRRLLRLPLIKDYHIDLGFQLRASGTSTGHDATAPTLPEEASVSEASVSRVISSRPLSPQALDALLADIQSGLPLVERPYQVVAKRVGCSEGQVIDALAAMLAEGVIKRLGVVVRHHELGYRANAMVVWNVPDADVDGLGRALGDETDVTLCYRRPRVPGCWPYNLFCMIHGQDRTVVSGLVQSLVERHGLQSIPRQVLFSGRRFKQRGARYRQVSALPVAEAGVALHG